MKIWKLSKHNKNQKPKHKKLKKQFMNGNK